MRKVTALRAGPAPQTPCVVRHSLCHRRQRMRYFEAPTDDSSRLRPQDLVGACMEHDSRRLLLDHGSLPADFFDLSSGVAGELVQKLTNYGIRMAAVVPDLGVHSTSFRDFAREANQGAPFRFFQARGEAVEWLTTAG